MLESKETKMKEAMLYTPLEEGKVQCYLCSHRCIISLSRRGICGVRENKDGKLYTLVFGRAISLNIDPIEKKPLFHLFPGSTSFSIATVGCNFRCLQCQNHEISQMPANEGRIEGRVGGPGRVIHLAGNTGLTLRLDLFSRNGRRLSGRRDSGSLALRRRLALGG